MLITVQRGVYPAPCVLSISRVEAMYKERDAHWNVSLQQVAGEAARWQLSSCLGFPRFPGLLKTARPPQFSFSPPEFLQLPKRCK